MFFCVQQHLFDIFLIYWIEIMTCFFKCNIFIELRAEVSTVYKDVNCAAVH